MTKPHPQRLPAPAAPSSPTGPSSPAPADNNDDFGFSAPDYDPDEYRWVPVRRRARYDGWTEEKQRRFIEVLADTGLVSAACKEVGMTRASAYRLRRAAHAGAFARAWDRARELAGALIEDIAFERALEGVEVEIYDGNGELSGVRTVYNDRLLTFLLRHLKPETYSAAARERRGGALLLASGPDGQGPSGGDASLDEALRAMEPEPPAPPEQLVAPDQLETDLVTAEVADGHLPHFLSEQRAPQSPEELRAGELAAQYERGRLAYEKEKGGARLSDEELQDLYAYLDPIEAARPRKKHRRDRAAAGPG